MGLLVLWGGRFILLLLPLLVPRRRSGVEAACRGYAEAEVAAGLCVEVFASGLARPRGLFVDVRDGSVLVVEQGMARVLALYDDNGDGRVDRSMAVAEAPGLNHGVVMRDGFLYASSDNTVFRWRFDEPGAPARERTEVVVGVNAGSDLRDLGAPTGHRTRTLVFDDGAAGTNNCSTFLYISVGSFGNVDADSSRARVRRCDVSGEVLFLPVWFADCEVWADGLRNEVGLAFDRAGTLWGVENGADNLFRADLGGDITNDNPAEELNRLVQRRTSAGGEPFNFGYPWCFSEYLLDEAVAGGPGTIWAWSEDDDDPDDDDDDDGDEGKWTDARCRSKTRPAALSMQAHSAPLGIAFYYYKSSAVGDAGCAGSLGPEFDGDAFVAFHGSWNRDVPTGYKVIRIPMRAVDADDGLPTALPAGADAAAHFGAVIDVVKHEGAAAKWPSGLRPVDVKFDRCGRLLVSSDGPDGEILHICQGDCVTPSSSSIPPTTTTITTLLEPTREPTPSLEEPTSKPTPVSQGPSAKTTATPTPVTRAAASSKKKSSSSEPARRAWFGPVIGIGAAALALVGAVYLLFKVQMPTHHPPSAGTEGTDLVDSAPSSTYISTRC